MFNGLHRGASFPAHDDPSIFKSYNGDIVSGWRLISVSCVEYLQEEYEEWFIGNEIGDRFDGFDRCVYSCDVVVDVVVCG